MNAPVLLHLAFHKVLLIPNQKCINRPHTLLDYKNAIELLKKIASWISTGPQNQKVWVYGSWYTQHSKSQWNLLFSLQNPCKNLESAANKNWRLIGGTLKDVKGNSGGRLWDWKTSYWNLRRRIGALVSFMTELKWAKSEGQESAFLLKKWRKNGEKTPKI